MVGSLTLPHSEPVMQPCRFAGHWEVFSSCRGTAPCWEGEDLRGDIALPGGPQLVPPQLHSRGSQEAFPCLEKGTHRGPGSHTPAVAPLLSSLDAPSRPYLPGMAAPAPPAASQGNQWGAHGPYRRPAAGRAPCCPYQWGGSRPGAEGSQPHPCRAGARAGCMATAPR